MTRKIPSMIAMLALVGLAIVGSASRGLGDGDGAKLTAKRVEERFYRGWLEIKIVRAGVADLDQTRMNGILFDRKFVVNWPRRGELSPYNTPACRIDVAAEPMRLDLAEDGRTKDGKRLRVIRPCIFKFHGEELVIASKSGWRLEQTFEDGKDYPERPSDFTSTKENKVNVYFYKPSGYLELD